MGDENIPDREVKNPRLIDPFGLGFTQDDVDFAIPHLKEDLPFALDPFLLWKSDQSQFRELHEQLLAFFENLRILELGGGHSKAKSVLLEAREAVELGLGFTQGSKQGSAVGPYLAEWILGIYSDIVQIRNQGLNHIEIIGLIVPKIAEDRISDLTASVLKRFLIDFTRDRAKSLKVPMQRFSLDGVWDHEEMVWRPERTSLPFNPLDGTPLLFAPLEIMRHLPWINYEDYYKSAYSRWILPPDRHSRRPSKQAVLDYNRQHYQTVEKYVQRKEETAESCQPDPLFRPLQIGTLNVKLARLRALPTGREDENDQKYEQLAFDLLTSLLYPELEFAESQVRTVSGAHIRDIILYNDGKVPFLKDLRDRYQARQIVFELKNVKAVSTENVNQLYRYLDEEIGHFGVLVTRHAPVRSIQTNIVDLHSSKRSIILVLTDEDLSLMVRLKEARRRPIEALKKAYVDFTRKLPK